MQLAFQQCPVQGLPISNSSIDLPCWLFISFTFRFISKFEFAVQIRARVFSWLVGWLIRLFVVRFSFFRTIRFLFYYWIPNNFVGFFERFVFFSKYTRLLIRKFTNFSWFLLLFLRFVFCLYLIIANIIHNCVRYFCIFLCVNFIQTRFALPTHQWIRHCLSPLV